MERPWAPPRVSGVLHGRVWNDAIPGRAVPLTDGLEKEAVLDLDPSDVVTFAHIARHLASQVTEQDVLDAVVALAVERLPGCDDAGIMLLTRHGHVETAAATSDRVRASDEAQAQVGEGPCFDAALERGERNEVFRCEDTRSEQRWPRYMPRARALGMGCMLGFQLFHHDEVFGALNLYSDEPRRFDAVSEMQGWGLASHAAVALTAARTSTQLRSALRTSRAIGQALGMVRVRYDLDEEKALAALKRLSQNTNTKLSDLAERVVDNGGELPD